MRFRFPRRRRHFRRRNSWFDHSRLHARAAKLGWRRRRRSRRRNPGPVILGGNPFRLGRRLRRGRRSYRRMNPAAALSMRSIKGAFSMPNLVNVAGITGGFVLGVKATQFIVKPAFMKNMRRFAGAVHVLAGFIIGAMGRKPLMKSLGLGFASAGIYDLVTQNVPQLKLSPVSGVDLDSGEDMSGADVIDISGADAGEIEVVGADLNDDDAYAL